MSTLRFAIIATVLTACATAWSSEWSEAVEIRQRITPVVSYRAKLLGDVLLVEAKHSPGWHTYSMDNIERARARTGKEKPETELPTVIRVSGALKSEGSWYQTKPKDLSQEDIYWYTWGFEGVSVFATKVAMGAGETVKISIDAQACNDTSCKMIQGVSLSFTLPTDDTKGTAFDLNRLVPVKEDNP